MDTNIKYPDDITNIALFGIDSRSDKAEGAAYQQGLSDSIMIISINATTGSVKLVSVMRDSLVKIEGHGYQKVNAAYSIGGPELAIKTLNQNYRLNIKEYATVDFVGMAEIVDAVGGVEVTLTKYEVNHVNDCIRELAEKRGLPRDYVSKSGKQTLNGVQAVGFSRVRKVPTVNGTRDDYGRTERQRLVMNQLFEKALKLPLTKYPSLIKSLLPYVQTSMGYDDIFKLAKVLKADNVSMQQSRIPTDKAVITGSLSVPYIGSCVYYDLDYAADILNAFFFDNITFEKYEEEYGVRKMNWYGASGYSDVIIPGNQTPQSTDKPVHSTSTKKPAITDDTTNFPISDSGSGTYGSDCTTDETTDDSSSPTDLPETDDPTDEIIFSDSVGGDSSDLPTDTGTDSDEETEDTEDTEDSETSDSTDETSDENTEVE